MNTGHFAGRIGRDAEIRHTPSGDAVANFSLAVDVRKGKEKATLWVDCAIWGKRGETLAPYLTKGTIAAVAGEVNVRAYLRQGEAAAAITCNVREITLFGGGTNAKESTQGQTDRGSFAQRPGKPGLADDFIDDEVPF